MRFVSIILDPTWSYPRYGVVDLHRNILLCECKSEDHADEIAGCMNLQFVEKHAKMLEYISSLTHKP